MATGDQSDMMARMQAVLPPSWFPDTRPVLDSILAGMGAVWARIYGVLSWVPLQTRIMTSTEAMLDLAAWDFFGNALLRRAGEADGPFLTRIQNEMFRERGIRAAVVEALIDLTGVAPWVFEPARPADTGGYGTSGSSAGTGLGYGCAGGYGSLAPPFQFFVIAYPGTPEPGPANVMGYYAGSGWAGGGYGQGAIEYATPAWQQGLVADSDIDNAVSEVLPINTIAWTAITETSPFTEPPGAVTGLAAGSVTQTSVALTWTAPAGGGAVGAYDVLYRVTGSGAFSILASTGATNDTLASLYPNTSYDFAVFAANGAGPGALSNVVTVQTVGAVPNTPGGFSAAAATPAYSSAALSWAASVPDSTHGPAASYTVSYSAGNTGAWTVLQSGITGLFVTVTGLAHDTLYGFKVDAVNSDGTNVTGATTTLTTDYAPPNVPTALSVAPVPDGTTSELSVAWTASATDGAHDAATGYDVRYSLSGAGSWTTQTGVTSGVVLTGLTAGTAYDVQARATNASTTSPSAWSATVTATTWATALVWGSDGQGGSLPPTSPVSHTGSWPGGGLNFAATNPLSHPSGMTGWLVYDTQGVVPPSTGNEYAVSCSTPWTSTYGQYLAPPPTAGTWYVWAELTTSATAGAGSVTAAIVSGPITVT